MTRSSSAQQHPAPEQLQAFDGGTLADDAAVQAISLHLDECPDCLRFLEGLPGDTLQSLIHSARVPCAAAPASTGVSLATSEVSVEERAGADGPDVSFLAPPQAPDEIGRLGHYRILKVLGSGGMGMVFQAEDINLARRVALKVMRPEVAKRADARERFLREAKLAAAIEHDHIVPIYHVGEANGVPFLAMPWLKGMSLEERLSKTGKLSVPQVLRLGKQIAQGLAAAHERGLIHRDIKPGNLWLEPEQGGRIKILDFGLARPVENDVHLTQSGTIMGTPAYMAPEQAQAQKPTPACDLFSLGVVLYRLCTGTLPFQADNSMAMLLAVVMNEPVPPSAVNPNVPAALSDLILELLVKDPARRPAPTSEVVKRLARLERELGPTDPATLASAAVPAKNFPAAMDGLAVKPATGATGAVPSATVIEPGPKPAPTRPIARSRLGLMTAVAAGLLFVVGAGVALYQIAFATPQGTLIVEINDKDVEARFKNGQLQLLGPDDKVKYTLQPSESNKKIPAGPYKIQVTGADGLTVDVPEFVMKQGDKVTVKVQVVPPGVAEAPEKKVPPAPVPEPPKPQDPEKGKPVPPPIRPGRPRPPRVEEDKKGLPADADPAADRKVAEWVLGLRGRVAVDDGKSTRFGFGGGVFAPFTTVYLVEHLPAGPWALRGIDLGPSRAIDDDLKQLSGLKNLQILILTGSHLSEQGLKDLKDLPSLQTLDLTRLKLTDRGLKPLAGFRSLKSLSLEHTFVTGEGLKELAGLTNLQVLNLASTNVTDEYLKEVAAFKGLTSLNLDSTRVKDDGLKVLAGMKLKFLGIPQPAKTDLGLKYYLAATEPPDSLTLSGWKLTDASLKELAGRKSLKTLSLNGIPVSDEGVKELKDLTNLQTLDLSGTKVTGHALKELAGLKTLTALQLSASKVTNEGLKGIVAIKGLKVLNLGRTQVTDEGLKELKSLPNLTTLHLSETQVTDEGLKELAEVRSLDVLWVVKTKVTAQGLADLKKKLPWLKVTGGGS